MTWGFRDNLIGLGQLRKYDVLLKFRQAAFDFCFFCKGLFLFSLFTELYIVLHYILYFPELTLLSNITKIWLPLAKKKLSLIIKLFFDVMTGLGRGDLIVVTFHRRTTC